MFSKLLAFGLCAVTFAAAVPTQKVVSYARSPSDSASGNIGAIVPGVYQLYSVAVGAPLKADRPSTPVLVTNAFPVGRQEWKIEPGHNGNYRIENVEYGLPITEDKGFLILGGHNPTEFAVDHAEGDTIIVKVPASNQVWTVSVPVPGVFSSTVQIKGADGSAAQRWRLVRIR